MNPLWAMIGIAMLLVAIVAFRAQYDHTVGQVTNPDPDATPIFPVVTPVVQPICSAAYNGSDCLRLP